MKLFRTDCLNNWGDNFTEFYFREVKAIQLEPIEPPQSANEAELIGAGSVLGLTNNFSGAVLGAGLMFARERCDLRAATVYALRGKLTQERCALSTQSVLGDLGLLASDLSFPPFPKIYKHGIIPHYVDRSDGGVVHWSKRDDTLIIDIRGGVRNVLSQASQCEKIVSSSLHGLVLADSLGIPNAWVELGSGVAGAGFKFRDYYSVFGESIEPSCIHDGFQTARVRDCEKIKSDLRDAVSRFISARSTKRS